MTDNKIMATWHFSKVTAANIGSVTLSKETMFAIDDLINRQKEEIRRLKEDVDDLEIKVEHLAVFLVEARHDAVEEFAERFENELSEKVEEFYFEEEHENFMAANKVLAFLDNLVKEFTEGKADE